MTRDGKGAIRLARRMHGANCKSNTALPFLGCVHHGDTATATLHRTPGITTHPAAYASDSAWPASGAWSLERQTDDGSPNMRSVRLGAVCGAWAEDPAVS